MDFVSKRIKGMIIFSFALLVFGCMLNGAETAEALSKAYLKIVYPTSEKVSAMSDKEAYDFYSSMNFWYRVPADGFKTGIFNPELKPQYRVFLFPDTCMRIETAFDEKIKDGFISDEVIEGSNSRFIEVSSFGWMMFPYGAYYNWAKGSGIYLDTEGKTISGYNKITVVYKIYEEQNNLKEFYEKLKDIKAVKVQILGTDKDMTQEQYDVLVNPDSKAGDWKSIPKDAASHDYKPLAVGIMYDSDWKNIRKEIAELGSPEKAYEYLVKVYVNDHNEGKYDQSQPRFQYFIGEANADIDAWMYDKAKEASYNVIQMTLEPNSAGSPTFELCDVRWPKVTIPGKEPAELGEEAIEGLQAYNLKFIWEKIVSMGLLKVRDPFDLMNDKKAYPIKVQYPENTPIDKKLIVNPQPDFPKSWLPEDGWGLKQAEQDGYISTDSFLKWVVPAPCPDGLEIPEKDNKGSFIKFGLNDEGSGGFSATDISYNIKLLDKNLSGK